MNRVAAFLVLAASLSAALPLAAQSGSSGASGTPGLSPADGLENWKYGLDLDKYAPGKYNLVVEGKDKAGNVTRATPMNIYVDPKAGLPVISIINPTSLMRVGGDLNIVGTCVSSEKVDKVELSLDGGEYAAAEGGEFWSFFLKTAELPEGRRTLEVRGIDAKGRTGPVAKVKFDLDRTAPAVTIESPAMGSLVAGQVHLSGKVYDANGVRSLEISKDGGSTWTKVPIKKTKDQTRATFSWSIDTRKQKLKDGPNVFSLRAIDQVGSSSVSPYLLFVENAKPTIELARPELGKPVHGKFALAGAVRSAVGLKRLSYEFGSAEKGEIPLTKGDPFFVKELDAARIKGDSVAIVLIAEDPIGNVTRFSKSFKIDHKADRPTLKVLGPAPAAGGPSAKPGSGKQSSAVAIRAGDPIWGSISDFVGVSAFRWSLDGSTPAEVPCSETFFLVLPKTSSGRHSLSLVPINSSGIAGDPVALSLDVDGGPAAIDFVRFASPKASRDFSQGAEAAVDSGEFLEGAVTAPNPPVWAGWSIADGKPRQIQLAKGADPRSWSFRIPIDRSLPYGFAPITVAVKDAAGNEYRAEALLYVTDYAIAREEAGFRFADPRVGEDGRVAMGKLPLAGAFYGGELQSLRLEPQTDLIAASFDGRVVWIAAVKEGTTVPTRILGKTKQGREFASAPMVFVTDSTPPVIKLDSPAEGTRFNGKLSLTGSAANAIGPATLSWRRLPDGERNPVELARDGSFSIDLLAARLPAGPLSIEVEARNQAGLVARAYRGLVADSKGPAVTFIVPEKGETVWGPEDVAARIDSAAGVQAVEFAADGKTFTPIESKGAYFVHRADFAANPAAAYRVTDLAGNRTVCRPEVKAGKAPARIAASPTLSVETAAGEAKVELSGTAGSLKASLSLPALPESAFSALGASDAPPPERFATRLLAPGALALKGQARVEGKAKAVSLSVDGGSAWTPLAAYKDEKSAKSSLPFSLSVEAAKLPAGAARWAIKVEDFDGNSFYCPLYCLFDAKAPTLAVLYPEAGTQSMPGPFPLAIKAEDENGLASGEIAIGAGKDELDASSGGRYFVRMLEPQASPKAAPIAVGVRAKDQAGNQASLALKYGYDAALASPKLREDSLAAEAGGLVSGLASGGASGAPVAVRASVDGGEVLAFPSGAYAFALPALAVGKHFLSIEMDGAAAPVKREFSIKGTAPTLGDLKIAESKSSVACLPGAEIALGPASYLAGSVAAANGVGGVSVSFNGGPKAAASLGKAAPGAPQAFSAPVPAGLPYGRVTVEIDARDATGQTCLQRVEIHKVLPPAAGTDDEEGIRFWDSRISLAEGKASFLLSPSDKLRGRFNGRPIRAAAIKPETPSLSASFDGSFVSIEAKAEGLVSGAILELTTADGDIFKWGPFSSAVGAAAPSLELSSPSDHDWVRDELKVAGKASGSQGIEYLRVSVNGGEPVSVLEASSKPGEVSFDKVIPLQSAPDGSTRIEFILRDAAGRETRLSRFLNKDTAAPELTQVLPAAGESVNGLTTFIGEAKDSGRLASAVFLAPLSPSDAKGGASGPVTAKAEGPATMQDWIESLRNNEGGPKGRAASGAAGGARKPVETKSEEVQGLANFSRDLDLARLEMPLPEGCGFAVTDKAGNRAVLSPVVVVDKEADKPVVEIDTPADMEVLRGDFLISGVAYDDDGLAAAFYRIDGGAWTRIEMQGPSFSIPIALKDTTDNEHTVDVKAEDIYGVQGDIVSRKYRISKEEPVAKLLSPSISKPVRGIVKLAGSASDANGIKEVTVSVDNRSSYDLPVGTESWSIDLDTTTLSDGIHAVAVRPVDGYDVEGFYASMIAVDNTPPKAQMDLPRDGEEVAASLSVSGRISDNIAIAAARLEVAPINSSAPPPIVVELGPDKIVQQKVDVSSLKSGIYAVRLIVRDRADNESMASRNVNIIAVAPVDTVSIVFPVEGARASAKLRVQGRAIVASGAQTVSILSDGAVIGAADPDPLGWYSFEVPAGTLADGAHVLKARTSAKDGRVIESAETRLEWSALGQWVAIDSFPAGKYLDYRPYLKGRAGWDAEAPPTGDKKALDEYKKAAKLRQVAAVDVSLDDGRSFSPAKGKSSWSFRLETQDFKEGPLHVIVRARYADGTTVSSKSLFFLDKTPPEVQILSPSEGGRFNGKLEVEGRAYDENGLASVGIALRNGDKSRYELPSFIQGLFLDAQALGATTWMAGAGLSFFSDNVKLEAQYGQAPEADSAGVPESFYGTVFGGKLIANVLYLPFGSFFGPDWDFLSTSIGLGASFDYFSETQSGSGLVVGDVFAQLEFPKITFRNMKTFKKISFYTEYQLWVLSSVVEGGFISKVSFGARLGIF